MRISKKTLLKHKVQRAVDRVFFVPFSGTLFIIMRYVLKYRVKDLEKTRLFYKEIIKDPRPILICANHLTYIDSILIIWMFGHPFWYGRNFNKITWNMPNSKYGKNLLFKVIGYVGKCIFINRKGPQSHINEILDLTKKLLNDGEIFTIFPEGTRSQTGRFETKKLVYGPGKLVNEVENCRVLCVYIRGDKQEIATKFPPKGSFFDLRYKFISPKTEKSGREAYTEIVSQIGSTLVELENEYFSL